MTSTGTTEPRRKKWRRYQTELFAASPLTYVTMIAAIALSIFPLYFMLVVATRTNDAVATIPPPLTLGGELFDNINRLLNNEAAYFLTGMTNTAISSAIVTLSVIFTSTLAGFAFAKLKFKGRNAAMMFVLITTMVPAQLGVIPLLIMMSGVPEWMGGPWTGTLPAVIVPFLVSAFGVFMMRQYVSQSVPDELIEAARVDGCNTIRIYWNVVLPALRPAIAVLGLFAFMAQWNEFFWASVVMGDPANPTVQVSLQHLSSGYYNDYTQVFAGTLLSVLPLFVVFILFGRQLIGGIMEGAIKA
ncbi:cellobiose transport system permease protein [Allocatelliglobosispora scoriae]|uniref:Cellobiose transport system permease protein n=2 Tax=Allocatelliglobosispora scoriae TaxID=643052 RepID=A0A841C0T4_9ACTN|nr:cellobiose transport system permease protein [Allocatelliglobosispora scoriae]